MSVLTGGLVSVWRAGAARLEVKVLPSLLALPGPARRFLLNSGNEFLVGTSQPYFPLGGQPGQPANICSEQEDWQTSSRWDIPGKTHNHHHWCG